MPANSGGVGPTICWPPTAVLGLTSALCHSAWSLVFVRHTHLCGRSDRSLFPVEHFYSEGQPTPHIMRRGCIGCGGRPRQARAAGDTASTSATASCPPSPSGSRASAVFDILPLACASLIRSLAQGSSSSSHERRAAASAPPSCRFAPLSRDSYHACERYLLVDQD